MAGNELQSSKMYKALDETAVFVVTKFLQDFSIYFMVKGYYSSSDLHYLMLIHLCRISYAVYMIECLLKCFPNQEIKLLYDVSCTLKSILQVCNCWIGDMWIWNNIIMQANSCDDLLAAYDLGVPIFHCYGQKLNCQVCSMAIYFMHVHNLISWDHSHKCMH